MASNRSAFVDGAGIPLRLADSPMPQPGPDDIIIKNHAVAINTIDPHQAESGFLIKQYPVVLGSDVAGEVHSVGSNVTRFKKGDRVVGHAWVFHTGHPEDGAFSLYTRVPASNATIIPSNIEYKQAAMLPMAIDTAAVGLYKEGYLGVDFPTLDAKSNGKVLVVYGGSTSVGAAAIQLAVNAGVRVIATSSPKHFDLVRECGASDVFDYKDAAVAEKIAKAIGEDQFIGLWNAIGIPESFDVVTPIMQKLGGGLVANTKPPPGGTPENMVVKFVLGVDEATFPLWESGFLTQALGNGKMKCLPEPMVAGKGLESLQKAFEVRKGYISGKKVVVEL